jgi:hypothetical protein
MSFHAWHGGRAFVALRSRGAPSHGTALTFTGIGLPAANLPDLFIGLPPGSQWLLLEWAVAVK